MALLTYFSLRQVCELGEVGADIDSSISNVTQGLKLSLVAEQFHHKWRVPPLPLSGVGYCYGDVHYAHERHNPAEKTVSNAKSLSDNNSISLT